MRSFHRRRSCYPEPIDTPKANLAIMLISYADQTSMSRMTCEGSPDFSLLLQLYVSQETRLVWYFDSRRSWHDLHVHPSLSVFTTPTMASESPLQLLFLGTGTSTGLPLAPCLTLSSPYPEQFTSHVPLPAPSASKDGYNPDGSWPNKIPCACCRSAVNPHVSEGWKNKRGNTSVVLRKRGGDGRWKNVVVDVGKTFTEQTRRFFPRWGVQTIDAVLLTHGRKSTCPAGRNKVKADGHRCRCVLWAGRSERMVSSTTYSNPNLPQSANLRQCSRELPLPR